MKKGDDTRTATYTGKVTAGAQKRIRKAVDLLITAATQKIIYNPITQQQQPFSLAFITLTVASETNITAKEAYKELLSKWLLEAKRKFGLRSYVWKAELQKRGQIHYHITTNTFITLDKIRASWNRLQQQAGLLENYYSKHGHYNPNSIDVKSVVQKEDIASYLCKYIAKQESEKDSTIGKVWDCSTDLKKAQYFSTELSSEVSEEIDRLISIGRAAAVERDNCTIITFQKYKPHQVLKTAAAGERYNKWLQELRGEQARPVK